MITSQILTYSGELEAAIGSDYGLNYFLAPLSTLNARDNFSLNLMHMPTPKWPEDLTEAELEEIGKRYLQCAGTAEAMTCEISKVVGGQQILFTIGHSDLPEGEPLVPVTYHFGEATTYVYPTELFDAEEAADLFFSYHQTQDIPAGYHLRRRSLRGTIANTAPKVNPTAGSTRRTATSVRAPRRDPGRDGRRLPRGSCSRSIALRPGCCLTTGGGRATRGVPFGPRTGVDAQALARMRHSEG